MSIRSLLICLYRISCLFISCALILFSLLHARYLFLSSDVDCVGEIHVMRSGMNGFEQEFVLVLVIEIHSFLFQLIPPSQILSLFQHHIKLNAKSIFKNLYPKILFLLLIYKEFYLIN